MKISIIITTYNRPDALAMVLQALADQQDRGFDILIADDGSDSQTKKMLSSSKWPLKIRHIWQEDEGFRAARIRNKAVASAQGDYLIFLDGDSVPLPGFVRNHRKLAEAGWFVAGNRALLSESFTETVLRNNAMIHQQSRKKFIMDKKNKNINRLLPLLNLPLGPLRKINAQSWRSVKTCNLGLYKSDFLAVNGFDEAYIGWGYEDSDLAIRLIRKGLRRKLGHYSVPVLHLWHPESDRSNEDMNFQRLHDIKNIFVQRGVNQYL